MRAATGREARVRARSSLLAAALVGARRRRLRDAAGRARAPSRTRRCAPASTPTHFVRATTDYFRDMDDNVVHGKRPGLHAGRDRGPQHVDGLDRRQRSPVGPADGRQPRQLRSAEDDLVASATLRLRPAQPLALPRARQRTVLHARRPGPIRTASGCGSTSATRTARRIRSPTQTKYPGVAIGARGKTVPVGSYYGEPTGVVGLRLFPNPDFDEKARRALELRALLQRSGVLLRPRSRAAVPRRHVVRVLSRRARIRSSRRPIPRTRSGRT